ncbi:HAMP domain-containing sensor histidine kinase [Clostridium subterminale]|uniref:histidine kinase n=1 Tax=Clostridium subterminale TaxID=1550 RepID=A0ABN1KGI3_CLOSU
MIFFLIIVLIISFLINGLDRYFYRTISNILDIKGLDSKATLNSLGYYNKSIFTHKLYGFILAFIISGIIYGIYILFNRKKDRELEFKIKELEELLININKGDYSIEIKDDDEYSILRNEIYKIIVNLKSLEEEARRQKSNLKIDLSNIAHQLKTPITSIGFMTELISTDRENTDIYLEKLNLELDRLKNFTEVLLKLSKVNSNTIDYKYEELSIREMVEDVVNSLNREKAIEVEYVGVDFKVLGDEVWLYEGFLNIIKNSLEYTLDKVEIEFISNPIYNEIKIKDNGKGLEEEMINRIFHRFYRGNTSMPGYGIGLNLSKTIIENHNGEIKVYNDNGLTFQIKFYNVT